MRTGAHVRDGWLLWGPIDAFVVACCSFQDAMKVSSPATEERESVCVCERPTYLSSHGGSLYL